LRDAVIVCTVTCDSPFFRLADIQKLARFQMQPKLCRPTKKLKHVVETTSLWCLPDHVRFVSHRGKQILIIDLSNCSSDEVEKTLRAVPNLVMTHPRNSVLILSDFTGASIDRAAILAIEETAVFDKPYVKKSVCVGIENFPERYREDLAIFSGRQFPAFRTREEALTWLVTD
jgi:hypothetical protein